MSEGCVYVFILEMLSIYVILCFQLPVASYVA